MSWTESLRKTFRVLSLRCVIEVGAMTMAVITLGCTGEGSPAGGVADPTRLACGAEKSFAGIEDVAPQGRFDGVSATVAATRSFAGLVDQEHISRWSESVTERGSTSPSASVHSSTVGASSLHTNTESPATSRTSLSR